MIPNYHQFKLSSHKDNCPTCRLTLKDPDEATHTEEGDRQVARVISKKKSTTYQPPCPHCTTPIHSPAYLEQQKMGERRITLLKATATDALVGISCGAVVAAGLCITASLPTGLPTAAGYLAMAATAYLVAKKVENLSRTQPSLKASFFGAFGGMVAIQYTTILGIIKTATVTSLPGCAIIPVAACCGAMILGRLERK